VLVARRGDRLRALADSLGPERVSILAADLLDDDAPRRILEHVGSRHGRLDLLVNNAGAAWRGNFADGGYENVRRTMAINFDAQVRLTEELLPLLRSSAPSAIVNVASTAGRVARAGSGGLQRFEVRPGRLVGLAVGGGALGRRPRRPGPSGLHLDRGIPAVRADRQAAHPLDGLNTGEGGRGHL
jgi:NAD(P)-dependent dehydrogenase (short-subunit alcohol dehydrogenase family)